MHDRELRQENILGIEHPSVRFLIEWLHEFVGSIGGHVVVGVGEPAMPFRWNAISVVAYQEQIVGVFNPSSLIRIYG